MYLHSIAESIAQVVNPALRPSVQALDGTSFFNNLLSALIGFAIVGGVILFAIMFLTGAINWMTAGGDQGTLTNAKKKVTNALIGIGALLLTFFIINVVGCIVGTNLLRFQIGTLDVSSSGGLSCSFFRITGGGNGGGTVPGGPVNIGGFITYTDVNTGGLVNTYGATLPTVWIYDENNILIAQTPPIYVNKINPAPPNNDAYYGYWVTDTTINYKAYACYTINGDPYSGSSSLTSIPNVSANINMTFNATGCPYPF